MQSRALEIERRLLALEPTVYDCKVIPRAAVGAGHGPGAERLVAYVVPSASVPRERLAEWITSLRRQFAGKTAAVDPAGCDMVAVSRLPLTESGQIDEAALCGLPVLEEEPAGCWEQGCKSLPGVRDAVAMVEPEQAPLPPIHYSKLFTEPIFEAARRDAEKPPAEPQPVFSASAPSEQRLAISHGGELQNAGQLPRLLSETLLRAAQQQPHNGVRTIGADGTEQFLSYPELLIRAERLLRGLRGAGLLPGDRVIFQLADNQAVLTALWACVLGGFVAVPAAPALSCEGISSASGRLCNAIKMLDSRLVLTSRELAPHIQALCGSPDIPHMPVESIEELSVAEAAGEWHAGEPNDVALMMLTSGSTGMPKAVQLTHSNLILRSAASVQLNGFSSGEITLNWMALDHVAGIVYFHLRDVFLGCQQIHAATGLVLQDPLLWLEWLDRYRVTITFAPNFAFGLVNEHAGDIAARAHSAGRTWDLSCLRCLLNGAEAIVARTARRFLQLLAPYGLSPDAMWPVWGMSETSSGTTYSDRFRLESSRDDQSFVEVGRPIPGFSIRIVDENDQPIFERAIGRLQVKGGTVTAGYYNQPDLTAESFTADGWLKTGDLGYLDEGRLTITGREKDVIVINSVNYHCHEIEGVVEDIEGVEKSYTAACAVRDAGTNTDRLAIFFHPTAGAGAVSLELIKQIRRTVWERIGVSPDYLLPVERDAIPKTSIGKIQRAQLAKSFGRGDFADVVQNVEVLLGGAQTLPDWFFRPVWRRAELRGWRETGDMLVFADAVGLGERLRQEAFAAGQECVLVSSGSDFVDEGGRLILDPGNTEHYRRALDSLARRGFTPQSIVHLWTYGPKTPQIWDLEKLERAQEAGALSVLRLAQALTAEPAQTNSSVRSRPAMQLLVVGSHLQQVEHDGRPNVRREPPAFQDAPILGLLKSISQEHPGLSCRHLDLQPAAHEENAALILRELGGLSQDAEVAYRDGRRWVKRLAHADLPTQPRRPLPLEKGGLYLLSGGLGGIGLELAQYLLRRFQAYLILVGRTAPGDRSDLTGKRLDPLGSLETLAAATGGGVCYAALDVGDEDALRDAVQRAEQRWARALAGIFHLAGIYHERPAAEEAAEDWAAVLDPKLKGAWALHRLVENRPGALFVSFSSLYGFFGGYGVSAYSAANAFLDSFSAYQREFAGVNAYCISWSFWDEVGMSRGAVPKDMARARGFCAISPRQGLASMMALLERPAGHTLAGLDASNLQVRRIAEGLPLATQALVATVTGEPAAVARLASQRAGADLGFRDRYGVPVRCRIRSAPAAALDTAGRIDRAALRCFFRAGKEPGEPVAAEGELEKTIADVWREVLHVERLGVTDNFFDLGAGSLGVVQANRRLQDRLQRRISMTEMFQYPTVRALAAHLSDTDKSGTAPELHKSQNRGELRREKAYRARRRG